jgi:hypothetical protein
MDPGVASKLVDALDVELRNREKAPSARRTGPVV